MTRDAVDIPSAEPLRSGTDAMTVRPPGLRPLPLLQALRGVAALIVVVTHAASAGADSGFAPEDFYLLFGNFGVDIFFVISGFIIVYSSSPLYARPRAWARFSIKRLIRVVPLYWLTISIYLLYRHWLGTSSTISNLHILASYSFIPYPEPEDGSYFPFYFPGWTLEFELFFYACFSATLALRRTPAVFAVSAMMLAVLALGRMGLLSPTLDFWSSSLLCEFIAGCFVAEAYLRGARVPGWLCLLLAVASALWVLATSSTSGDIPSPRGIAWGLPATALVVAAAMGACRLGLLEAALVRLGDASYSLYVTHLLVIDAAIHLIQGAFRNWHLLPLAGYMLLMTSSAVGVAFLCFHLVERPMTRRLQRLAAR